MTEAETREQPVQPSQRDIREMYQRVLASWAMDALELRRRGLDRPRQRLAHQPAAPMLRRAA